MARSAGAWLILLAWPVAAAAQDPAPAGAAPDVAAPPAAAVAGAPPAAPPAAEVAAGTPPAAAPSGAATARKPFSLQVGWGYYEVLHAGATWHVTERAALELFGGAGFVRGDETGAVGLGFRHAIGKPIKGTPWGWDLKALFWTASDSDYDWKMFTLIAGVYAVRELDSRLSVKLDAGVALTGALESDRKQNEDFASPRRWNGSVCLELVYRLGAR